MTSKFAVQLFRQEAFRKLFWSELGAFLYIEKFRKLYFMRVLDFRRSCAKFRYIRNFAFHLLVRPGSPGSRLARLPGEGGQYTKTTNTQIFRYIYRTMEF
jgi:hypothetical protein